MGCNNNRVSFVPILARMVYLGGNGLKLPLIVLVIVLLMVTPLFTAVISVAVPPSAWANAMQNQDDTRSSTEVYFDGAPVSMWDTARDEVRLKSEYSMSKFDQIKINGKQAIQWQFVSRGVPFNDLWYRKEIQRPFDKIRIHIKNPGEAIEFAIKLGDVNGPEWTVPPYRISRDADWQWVEWQVKDLAPAPWSSPDKDGRLDLPLKFFTLIAFGVVPGQKYNIIVDGIELVRSNEAKARLLNIDLPARLDADRSYTASLSFELLKEIERGEVFLSFFDSTLERFRVPVNLPQPIDKFKINERVDVKVQFKVPLFVQGGDAKVGVVVEEGPLRASGKYSAIPSASADAKMVKINGRKVESTKAEVKVERGVPGLFINGRRHSGMMYTAYSPQVDVFMNFAKQGIDLFSICGTPTDSAYNLASTAWLGPGSYDFSELDTRIMMVLDANPNAYVIPRLYLGAPVWWCERHPDELVQYDPGNGLPKLYMLNGKPTPSWASEVWRKDTVEALKRLIEHVNGSSYADRVLGYHLSSGTTEEWMMWGANDNQWVDYSPANTIRFRQWLRAKYKTDAALQQAWNNPAVTFDTAQVPPKKERSRSTYGILRDSSKEQWVIDFYLYNSELVADTITFFAKEIKQAAGRDKIVGFFYGYLLQLAGEQRQQNAGHLALDEVLSSSDIDFLASPTSYAFRQLGTGTSHIMSLLGSVQAHGKLWFNENDIRTSASPSPLGEWGKPENIDGDILQQNRELAMVITNAIGNWWFDVGGNDYSDPRLMERIGRLASIAKDATGYDRTPVDQIAMVVDEESLTYLAVGHPLGGSLIMGQLPELARFGGPSGHYSLNDLDKLKKHKVIIFVNAFAPNSTERRAIDELKSDNRTLVFLYAPGLYRDGKLDEGAMAELTGIKLALAKKAVELKVTVEKDSPLGTELAGKTYGLNANISPIVYADDPQAQVLGKLPNGWPGLVIKRFENWTAVFSAAPALPSALVRWLAKDAGVHLYIDTPDVVWANKEMLAISVDKGGSRKINLPKERGMLDLYTGKDLGKGKQFTVEFEPRSTKLFLLK